MRIIRSRCRSWPVVVAVAAPLSWGACVYDWTWPATTECSLDAPCRESEYCVSPDHRCGEGAKGTCQPRPTNCVQGQGPSVCACNLEVHANPCTAALAGFDITETARCVDKPGTLLPCGFEFCRDEDLTEYCKHHQNADDFECLKAPLPCAPLDCSCSGLCEGGVADCNADVNEGLTVTCE